MAEVRIAPDSEASPARLPALVLGLRLLIGIGAGLLLGVLFDSYEQNPPPWVSIAATVGLFTAVVLLSGVGELRWPTLGVWAVAAGGVVALVAWHEDFAGNRYGIEPFMIGVVGTLAYPMIFIANELITGGDQARKVIAPYTIYYAEAWKRAVQLGLALLFTGLFWAIIMIGATLLSAIGFKWFEELVTEALVGIPLTGAAFAVAVHLGDARSKLLATARNILLGVLSWLLPVITAVSCLFVASLAVSGLEPLWETGAATAGLLAGSVFFVLLINAVYQDGPEEGEKLNLVLAWSVRIASVLLLIFAVLAAWGIWLRVDQYGLTPERVIALTGVLVAVLYGLGYSAAALKPGRWMALVQPVNVGMAMLTVGLFLALLTPLLSPARLSVDNQISRLEGGVVQPGTMDWGLLASNTGGYGRQALERLKAGPDAMIADLAGKALADISTSTPDMQAELDRAPMLDAAAFAHIVPQGATLPAGLVSVPRPALRQDLDQLPCQSARYNTDCIAVIADFMPGGGNEVLVVDPGSDGQLQMPAQILVERDGSWHLAASTWLQPGQIAALREGRYSLRRPVLDDLVVAGDVIGLNPGMAAAQVDVEPAEGTPTETKAP